MYQSGNVRARSGLRTTLICVLLALSVLFGALGMWMRFTSVLAEDTATQAIYLGMDKATKGYWYDTTTAPAGEEANAQNSTRVYGKDGGFITYAKITGDGQPVTDPTLISNATPSSTVNWSEYPDYVDSFEYEVTSTGDSPHGYWNYNEENDHGSVTDGALLSPDPSQWNRKNVQQQTHENLYFTVNVTDDAWHKVSVYVEDCSGDRTGWYHYLEIMDLNKQVITSVIANDYKDGIWYSFAVKGSFIVNANPLPGTTYGCYSGIFFDPMLSEEDSAAIAKENFSATLEGARYINLSWTNKAPSITTIYRKEANAPDSAYELITTVTDTNATSYRDTTAQVAKEYVYKLGSGVANADYPNTTDYAVPQATATVQTAQYNLTSVSFDKDLYQSGGVDEEITVSVVAMKDVKYDDSGNITDAGQPYADVEITFSLDGELVYDKSQIEVTENMDPVLGTVKTDAQGRAEFTFVPQYAGEFEIVATVPLWSNPEDETQGYDGSEGRASLGIAIAQWENAPVLASISDAIRPGETFTIMGTGLIPGRGFQVAIAPNTGKADPAFSEDASGLEYLEPMFTDAQYTSGVMLTLPETYSSGIYDVWVSNEYGWSNGITLNAARPLYISQEAAYEGLEIEIVGRNFFPDEFGMAESARDAIRVMLKNGDTEVLVQPEMGVRYTAQESVTGTAIDESNPYRLTIVIPSGMQEGVYEVLVANDGKNFRSLATNQTLQIVAKKTGDANTFLFGSGSGYDPLDLGVYWAQDLNYSKVLQLTAREGADAEDDTASIQQKIDTLAAQGGGIVFFNSGTYYASQLNMKDNVMLIGNGMHETRLLVRQDNMNYGNFILNPGSNNGIARMTISLDLVNGKAIPDMYLNFSDQPDSSSDVDLRRHSNVFVKEVFLDMPYEVQDPYGNSGSNRGLGLLLSGKKNYVIDDNIFVGYFAVLHRGFVNEYVSLRNNIFRIQRDVMHCMASYAFIENTALLGNNNDGHGWSARSDCYFGNNYISRVGLAYPKANNNGEIIMLEVPGAQINYGSVMGVSDDGMMITLDREVGVPMTTCDYNYFAVVITDGTGVGQLRYIEKTPVSDAADPKYNFGNTFRLRAGQKAWDVTPDQNSSYAIYVPIEHVTIYRNVAENCAKSILLYSQNHDALVAENHLTNTDGISVYSTIGMTGTKGTNITVRIERNTVEGVSIMTFKGGIGVMTERWTIGNEYGGMLAGNVSIRYNTVKNTTSSTSYVLMSEIPTTPGIYVHTKGSSNVVEQAGDISYTIVEGNTVENSCYGVYIDNRTYCTAIVNNTFIDIEAKEDITNIGAADLYISAIMTFDLQGGTMDEQSGSYYMNQYLPRPTREGYTFWGWSLTPEPEEGAAPIQFAPASNSTLYAVWTKNS